MFNILCSLVLDLQAKPKPLKSNKLIMHDGSRQRICGKQGNSPGVLEGEEEAGWDWGMSRFMI